MASITKQLSEVVIMHQMPGGGSARELKKEVRTLHGELEVLSAIQPGKSGATAVDSGIFAHIVGVIKEQQATIGALRNEVNSL